MSVGTLLWIGPRDSREFHPIYQDCESRASQIAFRYDLDDAWWRPCTNIQTVVLARDDRADSNAAVPRQIASRYDCMNVWELLGPLCAGQRSACETIQRIYWHQWNQFVDAVIADSSLPLFPSLRRTESVVVVAETIANAEPLIELAASCDKTVVWCRNPTRALTRNFDVVWWDDSVAVPTSGEGWFSRTRVFKRHPESPITHVWITSAAQSHQVQAARDGGVDCVLTKPLQIESLLRTIDPQIMNARDLEEPCDPIVRAA